MTTTSATATAKTTTRKFDREAIAVEPMKTGLSLDLGYADWAYLANSVYDGPVTAGDRLVGTYRMEEGRAGRFARIMKVVSVDTPNDKPSGETPIERGPISTKAGVEIKNFQQAKGGFLIWLKNQRHSRPVFAPFGALKGINIWNAKKVEIEFHQTERRRLVATSLEVIETK